MEMYRARALGNGLRTDHPIPDLPFVDDAHIPVDDPQRVEAVGRRRGSEMWGRQDQVPEGGWVAFTTDPTRHDLAWGVRWHPDHGRSVVLYHNEEMPSVHSALLGPSLLFRAGGYWWDGETWYRPLQVWDPAAETYLRRPVPGATAISAADLLAGGGNAARGRVLSVDEVTLDAGPAKGWLDDLAVWAARRSADDRPLDRCVVRLSAPELAGDQLLSQRELALAAGVAASTVRAYVARGEGEVPLPQATVGGRHVWARPVAEGWAERRRRSSEGLTEAMSSTHYGEQHPPGVIDVWKRYAQTFMSLLWDNPDRRRRWALRWRNQAAVQDLAENLSWTVAAGLSSSQLIPLADLAITIRHAVLDEFATGQELDRQMDPAREAIFYGIAPAIARILDWLIRHHPVLAASAIADIVGEAERRLQVPRDVSEDSLRTALALDGKLDDDDYTEFFSRALTPAHS
ncbi:hypothetical protein [Parafrankia discariae]|uniref:hypothetical protein n=1 Tax=Parafrankia discariae TaxID=365528 RepID=UPI000360AB6E|nr:hypothetical protein [Parafrankia discariae]